MTKNLNKSDPSLADVLDLHKKDIFLTLNCHAIGQIQSFDPAKQTCTATMTYSKSYYERESNGNYKPVLVPYPVLVDVPVIVIQGGLGGVTMPIKKGDFCLIMFCDRDFDNWFKGASSGDLSSLRKHSLSDGIALVGLRQPSKAISGYQADKTVLFYGANKISVGQNDIIIEKGGAKITVGAKIKIEVGGQSLGALLQTLTNSIITMTTTATTTSSGNPIGVTGSAAVTTAMNNILGVLE